MTVNTFTGDPEVLYVALEYAYYGGVGVTTPEHAPTSRQ
jgi:hypothetical protein